MIGAVVTNLSPLDIAIFMAYTLALLGVGLYFTRRQKSLKTFLVANQSVPWYIVGVSVLAALFSGVTYMGAPAETFFHDLRFGFGLFSMLIATPIATMIFVPLFRRAQIYTAYEYLEQRFDSRLRHIASGLFILRVTFYLAVVIYAPSLAVMEVTGWPLWLAVLIIATCATIYTCFGGMQAVIWTDTLQFLVLCGGIVVILLFAASKVPGGLSAAWHVAAGDGKTRMIDWSLDPRVRVTVWGALLGGAASTLVQLVTDQMAVQAYLTAPSLKDCQRALWLKLWISLPLISVFYIVGAVLYAYYRVTPSAVPALREASLVPHLVQPLDRSHPLSNDRILPYFVVHVLPSPLRGLLIAALFGATIATVSAGVHSLATATLIDFSPRRNKRGSPGFPVLTPASADDQANRDPANGLVEGPIDTAVPSLDVSTDASEDNSATQPDFHRNSIFHVRLLIVFFGALATVLALVVIPLLGTIVQAVTSIIGLFGGPLLGVFMLGALSRRANSNGALIGALVGAIAGVLVAFSPQWFGVGISFVWIAFVSAVVTYVVGWVASFLFRPVGSDAVGASPATACAEGGLS